MNEAQVRRIVRDELNRLLAEKAMQRLQRETEIDALAAKLKRGMKTD